MEELAQSCASAPGKTFDASLSETGLFPLRAGGMGTLQVNVGRLCNQSCLHCHVEAGPESEEVMARETLAMCMDALGAGGFSCIDITGGAPEMNPGYRWLVEGAAGLGVSVRTRTNLTILLEEGCTDLPGFFARNSVEVIGSLPYYLPEMTDAQRGSGVFDASIEALRRLNSLGYGEEGGELVLNLVYNPCGAFLPPSQKAVEADFRRELSMRYGVRFTSLYTIANMPIGRFLSFLKRSGNLERYMGRLRASYNPAAAANVMCRETLSVGWDGSLYDCDFNQMLGLGCSHGAPAHIRDFDADALGSRRIVTGTHCYACTAGAGSSCSGALA